MNQWFTVIIIDSTISNEKSSHDDSIKSSFANLKEKLEYYSNENARKETWMYYI